MNVLKLKVNETKTKTCRVKWTPLFGPLSAEIKMDSRGLPFSVLLVMPANLRFIKLSKRENELC